MTKDNCILGQAFWETWSKTKHHSNSLKLSYIRIIGAHPLREKADGGLLAFVL